MSIDTDDLEQRLSAQLQQDAEAVVARADGRMLIASRVRHRARRRRIVTATAIVVLVVLAFGVMRLGEQDEAVDVITDPGETNSLLLAPSEGQWWVDNWTDSQNYSITMRIDGEPYDLRIQTVNPDLPPLVAQLGPGEVFRDVNGYRAKVIPFGSLPSVHWEPAPFVLASVGGGIRMPGKPPPDDGRETVSTATTASTTSTTPPVTPSTAETALDPEDRALVDSLVRVANSLEPVDPEASFRALTPGPNDAEPPGQLPGRPERYGLPAEAGTFDVDGYAPWESIVTELNIPDAAAGALVLHVSNWPAPLPTIVGLGDEGLTLTPDPIRIRGTDGVAIDAPEGVSTGLGGPSSTPAFVYNHQLSWREGDTTLDLMYAGEVTREQALAVAESLRVLTDDEWRVILGF